MVQYISPEALDAAFHALSDRTRRAILARLAEGDATVNELAAPFAMSLPAVSKHLKVLERAGLISRGRAAQTRPCRIEAARLRDVDCWLAEYRALWEKRLDRLDAYLTDLHTRRTRRMRKKPASGNSGKSEDKE